MTWKKRIISIVLCLCALLCAASVRAEAADAATTHTDHLVCGGTTCDHKTGTHITNTPTWTAWNGGDITYDTNGIAYIYLSDDVTLQINNDFGKPKFLDVGSGKTLYLCLNGHSLTNRGSHTISVDGTLVLCDCKGSGKISHTTKEGGGFSGSDGIYVGSGAAFTMYGGTISSNNEGVQVFKGTFTMYGGKISNNDGRGVLVSGGTFTMYGGEISHNTHTTSSPEGGGGVWVKNYKSSKGKIPGNFAMYGGTICNNEIQSSTFGGGGVGMDSDGSFYMENGTITGNKCNNSGGGLDIRCKTITIKGNSTISNNTCDGDGGGIFAISSGESSITNCTISGNNATGTNSKGGGLAFQNSTFTLKECAITDNKATGKGGGIFVLDNTANLTLSSDLKFSGNQDNYPADKSGNLTTGTANDVFLHTGAYLRLACDFSKTSTAPIVVTTYFEPNNRSTVKIAEGSASAAKATDFTYGNDSAIGIIAKTKADGTTVELLAHKHNYSQKTDSDNHWQECSICKDIKGVTAHSGGEASCTKKAVCRVCNQPYGKLAAHVYDMTTWVKIDNDHHGHKCKNCNAIDESTKAPHTWDEGKVTTPATCTAAGVKTYTCTACSATKTERIDATGHAWDTKWSKDNDHHWHKCKNANCTGIADKAEHRWNEGEVTTPATCTTPGEKTFTCTATGCGATKTETIGAKGHDFSVRQYGENDHWMKCSRCDATDTKEAHSGGEATCTQKAVCEKCGQKYGDLKAHDFANGPYQYDGEQHWKKCANCDAIDTKEAHSGGEATCTQKAVCEKCGQKYGDLKAHDFANGPYQYDGEQHWKKCANCDAIDTKVDHSGGTASCTAKAKCSVCGQEYGGLKAHDFANGPYRYDGEQHWKKCANCDAIDTKEAHSGGEATCTQKAVCEKCGQEYGEKLAHSYTVQEHNEIQHWKKCANCTATTEPVAHTDFTAWKSDRSGHWHECSTCGYKTAVNAHTPDRDKATETTPQLCTVCGYVIAPATHPVHTWVFVAETPATCNATGVKEHYKCDCRRKSVTDGVYDIVSDTELILAINPANHTGAPDSKWHSDSANHWQEYTCCHARANEAAHSGGAATCTAQAVCQVCGKAYGPLAAHAWQPATCTAPKTCTACHVTDGAALGHDWGAWKVTTPATKDAPGVETRTCAHNSAHTETRSIPKLSTAVYTVSEDTKIAQIEAKVDGLDKILESNENKALINDGKSVGVSLTVKNTASSGVSEKIKEKLAGSNLVGLRLELTVEKTVTANGVVESKQTIPDAGVLLKTTITLPAELQGKSGYVVYRLHDGNVHVLTETANENGEFISVSADKTQITICARLYSEYVIAYQTGGSSGGGYHPVNPTPVKATSANTGDAGVLLYGVTAALSLTGTAWLGAKSRKH